MAYGKPGANARLYVAVDAAFSTNTEVADVVSVNWTGAERGAEEITTLADMWRQYEPTLGEAGSLEVELNYAATNSSASSQLLHDYYDNGSTAYWGLRLMESTNTTFTETSSSRLYAAGFITSLGIEVPGPGGIVKCSATIKLTGQPTVKAVGES